MPEKIYRFVAIWPRSCGIYSPGRERVSGGWSRLDGAVDADFGGFHRLSLIASLTDDIAMDKISDAASRVYIRFAHHCSGFAMISRDRAVSTLACRAFGPDAASDKRERPMRE